MGLQFWPAAVELGWRKKKGELVGEGERSVGGFLIKDLSLIVKVEKFWGFQ